MLLSLLIVVATGLGLVLFVWAVFAAFPVAPRAVTRSFWCRFRKQNISAEFQEDPKDCLRLRKLDPVHDSKADAEFVAADVVMEPRWITADADRRLAEELFVDRALR